MQKKSGLSVKTKHALILAGIIAGSFLISHILVLAFPTLFGIWNNQINDHLFRLRYSIKGKEPASPAIVHIGLTNHGIKELDIPVWNRQIFGRIINILNKVDAGAIVCDLMFEDPGTEENDELLITAAEVSEKIYFPVIFQPQEYAVISEPVGIDQKSQDLLNQNMWPLKIKKPGNPPVSEDLIPPFYRLLEKTTGTGHINLIPDPDGKNRRMPLLYHYKDRYMPALVLRVIADLYKVQPGDITIEFGRRIQLHNAQISKKMEKDLSIPIDERGTIPLNFTGPWEDSFFHFPVQNILRAETDPGLFSHLYDIMEDSLVIISDVSTRNKDYGPGIFHSVYPSSGLHLTLANMILTGQYLHEPGPPEVFFISLFIGILLWFFSLKLKPLFFYVLSITLLLCYAGSTILLFIYARRVTSIVSPMLGFFLSLIIISMFRILTGEKEKYRLRADIVARKKLNEEKKRFFQNIIHDMRTPLTLILQPLQSLMTNLNKAKPVYITHNLDLMKRNAEKLLVRVNELLDISRIEAGKMRLFIEKVDIISLLEDLLYSFKGLAQKKRITLAFKKGFPRLLLFLDYQKIEKVFSNLLMNALKFTGEGGKITVYIHPHENVLTIIKGKKNSPLLSFTKISIKDTGTGIPEKELPLIFDRFTQGEEITGEPAEVVKKEINQGTKGSGIGLSLVKELVTMHYGNVEVESTPGKGTEFIVLLPNGKDHFHPEDFTKAPVQKKTINSVEKSILKQPLIPAHKPFTGGPKFPDNPVLIVDDDEPLLSVYEQALNQGGITHILACHLSTEVMNILAKNQVSVIALDLAMPGMTGDELLPLIKQQHPEIPVIITTGIQTIESAVKCIKAGAYNYMVKPIEFHKLIAHIKHCVENQDLKDDVKRLSHSITMRELQYPDAFSDIVTTDQQILIIFKYIEAIARSSAPVFITGESGVGKELIARAIHKASRRKGKFIAVNIAEIDNAMFMDTLFGHKKGAYTNADTDRTGLIGQAKEGTLFLDEIGDLNMAVQVKLLRFLEERTYRPLGSDTELQTQVKIIAATNADINEKQEAGKLRKDLYYRFAQHKISIPPLRERPDDLMLLIKHFSKQAASDVHKNTPECPESIVRLLKTYSFPGNIRELKTMIYDVVSITESNTLPYSYFKEYITAHQGKGEIRGIEQQEKDTKILYSGQFPSLEEVENFFIKEALKKAGNIQSNAANLLGISKYALHRMLKKKKNE